MSKSGINLRYEILRTILKLANIYLTIL